MPVSISKTPDGYRVATPNGVKAKHTTKSKAEAQKRLLAGVDHGWKPTHESAAEQLVDQLLEGNHPIPQGYSDEDWKNHRPGRDHLERQRKRVERTGKKWIPRGRAGQSLLP